MDEDSGRTWFSSDPSREPLRRYPLFNFSTMIHDEPQLPSDCFRLERGSTERRVNEMRIVEYHEVRIVGLYDLRANDSRLSVVF